VNTQSNNDGDVYEVLGFVQLAALRDKLGMIYGRTIEEAKLQSDVQGANVDLFREILSRAKTDVSEWGGTLYFVYLPSWTRYAGAAESGPEQRTEILSLATTLGIPIIDVHSVFQAQKDPLSMFPFRGPGHYNEEGHRLVAEEVLKAISPGEPGER
jgi:hypothetical protein